MIEKDGWYLIKTKGDHRQYKHPHKAGRVTISGNLGRDMPPGTLNSVLKQAGLK
jgi:predicted RNA binding protein YcfA (HicA-like mRNA interferase family)